MLAVAVPGRHLLGQLFITKVALVMFRGQVLSTGHVHMKGSAVVSSSRGWPGPAQHSLSPFPKEGELVVAMCSRVMSLSDW